MFRSVLVLLLFATVECVVFADDGGLLDPIRSAKAIKLISLDPKQGRESAPDRFHEFVILGTVEIGDAIAIKEIVDSVSSSIDPGGPIPFCWAPRHGIRVELNGQRFDYLLCFECVNGVRHDNGPHPTAFAITAEPAKLLNNVLKKNGVPLPAQPKK